MTRCKRFCGAGIRFKRDLSIHTYSSKLTSQRLAISCSEHFFYDVAMFYFHSIKSYTHLTGGPRIGAAIPKHKDSSIRGHRHPSAGRPIALRMQPDDVPLFLPTVLICFTLCADTVLGLNISQQISFIENCLEVWAILSQIIKSGSDCSEADGFFGGQFDFIVIPHNTSLCRLVH